LYEIVPATGVRISRIKHGDDIALSLAALGIRIIAPIPGKGTIGIEVPNVKKTIVSMKTLLSSEKFQLNNHSLPIAIGKKIDNDNFIVDLTSMPHLLMAGATGQGKSVGVNAILVSLLYKKHPSQLKLNVRSQKRWS
jgi:S-DNA-T family DNA segregation ATPase FtsK/SpoIIIE